MMYRFRTIPLATSALLVAGLAAAGCSGSSSSSTTSSRPTPTTGAGPQQLPATGSVDGVTLSVLSSPLTGKVGATTIHVTATLSGKVTPSQLTFAISDAPSAETGAAATTQHVAVSHAGTWTLPKAFSPPKAGNWAVTVTYAPQNAKDSTLSVSGLPQAVGLQAPFPQLVTVVTSG